MAVLTGARIAAMTANRAPRAYVPMTGWKLARWLLFYLAMILLHAAVILAAVESI